MATGWKLDVSTFEVFTAGQVSATQLVNNDCNYKDDACSNVNSGSPVARIDAGGRGHVELSWTAVADLVNGGEIYGIGHSLIGAPGDFKGSLQYQVRDANGALILNKAYNNKDMLRVMDGGTYDAGTDGQANLVDRVTYDPNLAQYASLSVMVSLSGVMGSAGIVIGSSESDFC